MILKCTAAAIPEVMTLRKVAIEWSQERSVSWTELEDDLLNAAFDGDFQELLGRENCAGLYFADPETGELEPYAGPDLADRLIDAASDAELTFYYFARMAKEAQ